MSQLFDELKRRNVIRVAVAYLVAAWLVLQVADLVLENIGAPDWVMQAFMLLFALGFPLVLIFSWAYELTPEGLKREKEVDRSKSVTHETGRKLDQITIGMLVAVVAFVVIERNFFHDVDHGAGDAVPSTANAAPQKSVAVLAFEDLSAEGNQAYFADGLSEELLNVLAQIPDLQVAGRTSSFAFKGKDTDLREIGEILNVAHILEGSVRKSGNRIRVTAQLINAQNGFHLFSESYDRDLDDIFAVQDDIASQISAALRSEIIGTEAVQEATPTEIETYELYLEARQKIHSRNGDALAEASRLLDRALAIDPDYAPAMVQKALAVYLLSDSIGSYGDIPVDEALAVAEPLLERARSIDPYLAEVHAVQGLILPWNSDPAAAIEKLRHALDLNPNLDDANLWLSTLLSNTGQDEDARALLEKIVEHDPLYPPGFNNLVAHYVALGDYDRATVLVDRVARIEPASAEVAQARGYIAMTQGRIAEAIRQYRRAYEVDSSSSVLRIFYAIAAMNIGDFDTVRTVGIPGMRAFAMYADGDLEAARALLESIPVQQNNTVHFEPLAYFYVETGEYDRVRHLVETHYGSVDALVGKFHQKGDSRTGYMGAVAFAYRELGRNAEYEAVIRAMQAALDAQGSQVTQWQPHLFSKLEYAALVGDDEAAIRLIEEFIAKNGVNVTIFAGRLMAPFREDSRFMKFEQLIIERANAERAKLGMDPYRPVPVTN